MVPVTTGRPITAHTPITAGHTIGIATGAITGDKVIERPGASLPGFLRPALQALRSGHRDFFASEKSFGGTSANRFWLFTIKNKGHVQMASTSPRQRRVTGRVMHEFKHGELKSGRDGKGRKIKSRRQAIAIALEEAGSSKYESKRRNKRNLRRTEHKEAAGSTGQQERESRSHIGARGKRESTRAMGGRDARKPTARGRKAAMARSRKGEAARRQELYLKAKTRQIAGRSRMSKRQLKKRAAV